ncbi:COMM domain-containing protein 7-like [Liolophura sinensis]|uniref:COMM domain-containing protein 7-like n=1 Tax=Liolophura sinensis TaxID=3198878 RepID=UPI0031593ABF
MASFHYYSGTPPDSVFTNIQAVNKFSDEPFSELINLMFTFLADPSKSSRLLLQLDEFAEHNGVGANALKTVFKTLLTIPNAALGKNLGPAQLKEDLVNLGLSEGKADYFADQWKSNLVALSRNVLGQTLMVNQLVDMEWKFGVTASSSDVDKVGNTFLQLKLVINKGNGTSNVYMELTLPQFYSFLHEMEKAKSNLEYLS